MELLPLVSAYLVCSAAFRIAAGKLVVPSFHENVSFAVALSVHVT